MVLTNNAAAGGGGRIKSCSAAMSWRAGSLENSAICGAAKPVKVTSDRAFRANITGQVRWTLFLNAPCVRHGSSVDCGCSGHR
jgi:hypothetical protein